MIDSLFSLTVDPRSAPLALRERIYAARSDLAALLARARTVWTECAVLATCARFEIFGVAKACNQSSLLSQFAVLLGFEHDQPCDVRCLHGNDAISHLFSVAAGLESPILGEEQVLGQVREAFLLAERTGNAGPLLSAAFRGAIHAGRRVRSETQLNAGARSYARLAVEVGLEQLASPQMASSNVLVIGSGTLATEVVELLAARNVGRLTVASRHIDRAVALAARAAGRGCHFDDIPNVIPQADVIIACTSLSRPVLAKEVLAERKERLTIIDLGEPCNVARGAKELPGVVLKALEDITSASRMPDAGVFIRSVEAIVQEELEQLRRWIRARRIAPLIARLRACAVGLDSQSRTKMKSLIHARIRAFQERVPA